MATDHIKMPAILPVVRYLADGSQTAFTYPFPIFTESDLRVSLSGTIQHSGFTVTGMGNTAGGSVTFAIAPATGVSIILERRLPLERLTDFLEGGDFSARAINNELDYLMASLQQLSRDQSGMIRYAPSEIPSNLELPQKSLRANKALGFDADGNPIAVSLAGVMASPNFTASGTGADTRTSHDKFSDLISIKDFGAVGDGLTDDTLAIQQALTAHDSVHLPTGTFLITAPITLGARKTLLGLGQKSVIKAQNTSFVAIEMAAGSAVLQNLRIESGLVGVKLFGRDGECTQNTVSDIQIIGAATGIMLDGYNDSNKPCYWNSLSRILIEQPTLHGLHLKKSGAGDTPNANRFYGIRVYSKGAATTGSGFYVEAGQLNNAFIDCEANMNGATASSCFRVGAASDKTLIVNLLCESWNSVPNLRLDSGSLKTAIINLTAMSNGAAIYDFSGGNYDAINAGFPDKNRFRKTVVTDLKATLMRFDTEYIDTAGTTNLDLSHSVHLTNATNGAMTIALRSAASAAGVEMTIKKVDGTSNIVTITEQSGTGPDGAALQLGGRNDYVTVLSNGAGWYITSSNRLSGNTRFADTTGTYDIDMAVDTYLISSFGGTVTARLPPANAAKAVGRTITIKKTDTSGNAVTVTEQGGGGPNQSSQPLSTQYKTITVVSNGSQWYIVSKF